MDFVVTDPFTLPEATAPYMTEQPIYIDGSMIPLFHQPITATRFTRESVGLPAEAVVLASFNNIYRSARVSTSAADGGLPRSGYWCRAKIRWILPAMTRSVMAVAGSLLLAASVRMSAEAPVDALARDVERAEAVRAVKTLQRTYAQYSQYGLWNEMAALFADDAHLTIGDDAVTGRAAIAGWFTAQGGGRRRARFTHSSSTGRWSTCPSTAAARKGAGMGSS